MPSPRSVVVALASLLAASTVHAQSPRVGFFVSPPLPTLDVPFTVHVSKVDSVVPVPSVTSPTTVSLTVTSGTGVLGGVTSCVIPAGSTTCTMVGTTYSVAEIVTVTATVTSGDVLAPGTDTINVQGTVPTVSVSSPGPSLAGQGVTFTATVTGDAPTGNVQFIRAGDVVLCDAVALTGSGDTRTATCTTSSLGAATHSIGAKYQGDARNHPVTSPTYAHIVYVGSTNVARSSNGGVATASSTIVIAGANFGVAAVNDGVHTGIWGSGGGWNDANGGAFPDWVQVQFNGTKTIDKVVVVTLQDNYATPVEPTDATTFSQYGVTAFQVQTWNGSTWTTRATVTGNRSVKRTVTFPAVATDRIRILVNGALASYSRIVEIEAWTVGPTPTTITLASSQNPSFVGDPVTFTATVTGNAPTGSVSIALDGQSLCSGALAAGKFSCTATVLIPASDHTLVATYAGNAQNIGSTSGPFIQTVQVPGTSTNVALNGVATASSTYGAAGTDFGVGAVIDGLRTATEWGQGGGWADATGNAYPDWVQVDFRTLRTIDRVVVVTLKDDFASSDQPTDSETFTKWGITAYQVQTWNGTSWVTQATVSGNTLVKRTFTFPAVTTNRMRVLITGALATYSRLVEVEAWSVGALDPTIGVTSVPNPSVAGQAVTFTATVVNASSEGKVDFYATGYLNCFQVPVVDSKASCTGIPPVGTHDVSVAYFDGIRNATSPVLVHNVVAAPPSTNVALATNGGVATASSTIAIAGANFGVAAVNDGVRTGVWGSGGGWNDATGGAFPDWVQVQFNGTKTIDKVVVTTLQDNFAAPVEPTDATTFSQYGITAFQVQTWNGSSWTTRATVTGNTLVKRTVTFPSVTTSRIRILVTGALASYSRIVEVEAWTAAGASAAAAAAADDTGDKRGEAPALVKANGDAESIPTLAPAALAMLAWLVALIGLRERRRRLGRRP